MTYTASTLTEINGQIAVAEIGRHSDKGKAMQAAKKAARTRSDCQPYGPSSLAYIGRDVTAVVAW